MLIRTPHRAKPGPTTILGLLLALTLSLVFGVAGQAQAEDSARHHGSLHATKECSQDTGLAGGFCTITGSNLRLITPGSKVFYLEAEGATGLDSDIVLYVGPGNVALGHVALSFATYSGSVTLRGGTGRFREFRARVRVTYDEATGLWHWDGTYHVGD